MPAHQPRVPDIHTQHVLDKSELWLRELIAAAQGKHGGGLSGYVSDARRQELRERAEGLHLLLHIVRQEITQGAG